MRTHTPPGGGSDRSEANGRPTATRLLPVPAFRILAVAGVLVLTGAYVGVLWNVARVVGGSALILSIVALTIVGATLLAESISGRVAVLVGVGLGVVGYGYYVLVTPVGIDLLIGQADSLVLDAFALLTGLPILRMIRADVWALAYAPGPVFVSWYLVMRRQYVRSVAVGGGALSLLVLTSDAGVAATLTGVLAGIAAVGFGELDRRNGTLMQADVLAVLVALIMLTSVGASMVTGSGANPISTSSSGIGPGGSTVEGTLIGSPDRTRIVGSISLSPAVRFTVEADEGRYWRTGVYDRYTGSGWVRSGREREYDGRLGEPPGPREQVVQTYTAESRVATMPGAAEPVRVVGDATEITMVTNQRTLLPRSTFLEGDRYRVYSSVPAATPSMLRSASREYPDGLRDRYTGLPADTPDRLAERTARITAPADNPYDAALLIERYLERTKNYSLDVERPDGPVADAFLFEMSAGYCTYFATTMVAMLRSQGIPARLAVGYTSGQQVDDSEWVVRGLDSHAWVEVYFPGYGWITFDPTPGGPRQSAELAAIRDAREGTGGGNVDTDASEDAPLTTTTTTTNRTTSDDTTVNGSANPANQTPTLAPFLDGNQGANGTVNATNVSASDPADPLPGLPSPRQTVLGLVVLLGASAGAHRMGWTDRAYGSVRMRWQGRTASPEAAAERAFERLEILLARRYRPRHRGETRRSYLDSLAVRGLDPRVRTVFETYERARYAGTIDHERAEEAVTLVDAIVGESTPVLGWARR